MKGLVIAVCCLVALAVAEEEKLAEMSVQAPVSPGAVGANPYYAGGFGGQPFLGSAAAVGRQFMGGFPSGWAGGLQGQLPWQGGLLQQWNPWSQGGLLPGAALPGQGWNPWSQGVGVWNRPVQPWFQGGVFPGSFGGFPFSGGYAGQGLVGQQPLGAGAGAAGGVKGTLKK